MTEKEAIEYLEITKTCSEDNSVGELQKQMCDIAIRALGEIQQYREIGTVEDFERLAYLKKRYEDETYDYCGEYGASKCELKDRVEKLQEYEAIGTVEECRAAVEKQKPKKPDYEGDGYADGYMVYDVWICPCCGKHYEVDYDDYKCCPECGQAIDWSEEE